jgi:hypothetical protein
VKDPTFWLLARASGLTAYVLLPASWRLQRVPFAGTPLARVTYTAEGIPSDPLNIELVASREQVVAAMRAAGWHLADPITFRSGLRDAHSVLLNRPYPSAPMSTQYVWNRPQDLAFEQSVGRSPRRRHHVRLWRVRSASPGETLWVGAATYDLYVGISHFTGEVMHHIDPDVDAERDKIVADLARTGLLAGLREVERFRPSGAGQNGAGDTYRTDGRLLIAILTAR